MHYAPRLRAARHAAGIPSISQAAKRMNIARRTLSDYERGICKPGADALVEMSRLYRVPTDWLLGLSAKTGKR